MTAPNRRWPRFTLRTLFVVVTVVGTCGYWVGRQIMVRYARSNFEESAAGWEAEAVTTHNLCEASLRLLDAEIALPLTDRSKAAAAHLDRIAAIKKKFDVIYAIGMFGDFSEKEKSKAEMDAYYAQAQRLANENR